MDQLLNQWIDPLPWPVLLGVIGLSIAALGWGADRLVQEAVALSERWGVPKIVIGATIVSLGTTTPEAAVSVLAAWRGNPGLAMGNAVGSIICDTGLVLGMASLLGKLYLPSNVVNRHAWVQLGAGILLVLVSVPWANPVQTLQTGGRLHQVTGFVFLALLALYLVQTVRWSKRGDREVSLEEFEADVRAPVPVLLAKLVLAVAVVVVGSHILVHSVEVVARRGGVPDEVIAATLVAFGTSLPELVTAIVAVRRGHGDLAVGNVVGADILNVLFVAGASASATGGGLVVSPRFFKVMFPTMILVLTFFRAGIIVCKDQLHRGFGIALLGIYVLYLTLSYSW